jgi:hypothetical protein
LQQVITDLELLLIKAMTFKNRIKHVRQLSPRNYYDKLN